MFECVDSFGIHPYNHHWRERARLLYKLHFDDWHWRPLGPVCLMLVPCCLDKAGWLESDCGDKKSESDEIRTNQLTGPTQQDWLDVGEIIPHNMCALSMQQ